MENRYGACKATFKGAEIEENRTDGRIGRVVFGGWRNDGNRWTGGEYADAGDGAESRNYSR
jgi:hypothetical protein